MSADGYPLPVDHVELCDLRAGPKCACEKEHGEVSVVTGSARKYIFLLSYLVFFILVSYVY